MGWWTPEQPIPDQSVFLRPEHRDDLRLHLSYRPQPWPRVFEISPSSGDWLPLVEALCALDTFDEALKGENPDLARLHRFVRDSDPSLHSLLHGVLDVMVALRRNDLQMVVDHAKRLRDFLQETSSLPASATGWVMKTLTFIEYLADRCLSELILPGVYMHAKPLEDYKKWWNWLPSFHSTCQLSLTKFDSLLVGGAPATVLRIRDWLASLQAQVATFKNPHNGDPEVARFHAASALFTAASDSWFARKHIVLGLVALQRAAEWLLVAKCAEQQLLDYTDRRGILVREDGQWKDVSFANVLNALVEQSTSLHNLVSPLRELNAWRNLCGYAHHLSSPHTAVALQLCQRVRSGLRLLGNNQWEKAVEIYKAPVPVSLTTLLDPDNGLRAGVAELTPEELEL